MDSVAHSFFVGSAVLFVLSLTLGFLEAQATRAFSAWAYRIGLPVLRTSSRKEPEEPIPLPMAGQMIETHSARAKAVTPNELLAHAKTTWCRSTPVPIKLRVTLHFGTISLTGRASLGATFTFATFVLTLLGASSLVALHESTHQALAIFLVGFVAAAIAAIVLLRLETESAKHAFRELLERHE